MQFLPWALGLTWDIVDGSQARPLPVYPTLPLSPPLSLPPRLPSSLGPRLLLAWPPLPGALSPVPGFVPANGTTPPWGVAQHLLQPDFPSIHCLLKRLSPPTCSEHQGQGLPTRSHGTLPGMDLVLSEVTLWNGWMSGRVKE